MSIQKRLSDLEAAQLDDSAPIVVFVEQAADGHVIRETYRSGRHVVGTVDDLPTYLAEVGEGVPVIIDDLPRNRLHEERTT